MDVKDGIKMNNELVNLLIFHGLGCIVFVIFYSQNGGDKVFSQTDIIHLTPGTRLFLLCAISVIWPFVLVGSITINLWNKIIEPIAKRILGK